MKLAATKGWRSALGSLASRLVLSVLALLLGWLAPLHAGGPSPVATDDAPVIQLPAVAPSPVVQVFLIAYRGQGPPVLVFVPIGGGPAFAAGVDALYSPQAVTNEAGQVVERYSYTAFGERTVLGGYSSTTSRIGFNHGFTGLRDEGGLLFARARYFSPELGRFISRDPAGYVDGMGLYAGYYIPNGVDPSGLAAQCAADIDDAELNSAFAGLVGFLGDVDAAYGQKSSAYDAALHGYLLAGFSEEDAAFFAGYAERAYDQGLGLPSLISANYLDPLVQERLRREAFYGGIQDVMSDVMSDMYMAIAMNIGAGGFTVASRAISTSALGVRIGSIVGGIGRGAARVGGWGSRAIRSGAVAGVARFRSAMGRIAKWRSGFGGNAPTVYRVQGGAMPNASKIRFVLDGAGKISVHGDDMLFVNVNQQARALEFLSKRGQNAYLVSFKIKPEFLEKLRRISVDQRLGRENPGLPQRVDPTRAPDQYGIPKELFKELLDNIIPGTARGL